MYAVNLVFIGWAIWFGPTAVRQWLEERAFRKDVRKMEAVVKELERG